MNRISRDESNEQLYSLNNYALSDTSLNRPVGVAAMLAAASSTFAMRLMNEAPIAAAELNDNSNSNSNLSSISIISSKNANDGSMNNAGNEPNANDLLADAIVLCIITGIGVFGNCLTIVSIISRRRLRKVINMFLLHHCFINLTQCVLFVPFVFALLNRSQTLRGCELLGGMFVTMVTADVLNIAAMTACEAYRFEDFMQQTAATNSAAPPPTAAASLAESSTNGVAAGANLPSNFMRTQVLDGGSKSKKHSMHLNNYMASNSNSSFLGNTATTNNNKKINITTATDNITASSSNNNGNSNSTASFACVFFGLVMIWLSSIILHLGITLIGSDSKQFYNYAIRNCFFAV
jgi:hypothetical protein